MQFAYFCSVVRHPQVFMTRQEVTFQLLQEQNTSRLASGHWQYCVYDLRSFVYTGWKRDKTHFELAEHSKHSLEYK